VPAAFLGAAWMLGALAALQEATSWDAREADLMVGTSAGSVLASLLRAGVSVDDLYGQHCGEQVTDELAALPESPPGQPALRLLDEPCLARAARVRLRLRLRWWRGWPRAHCGSARPRCARRCCPEAGGRPPGSAN